MKKFILSVVCLMMIGIQSVNAQVAIATLHHNDSVTIFSASAIQKAVDAAVPGDTIYLSEGMFGGFKVLKPIVMIGTGQSTNISGNTTIGKYGSADYKMEAGLLISGMNFIQNVYFYGQLDGIKIHQCKIVGTIRFYGKSINNSYSYCNFTNIDFLLSQMKTLSLCDEVQGLTVYASKIGSVSYDGADEGSVTIVNCNVSSAGGGSNNGYVNCIVAKAGSGVYQNCLYNQTSGSPVFYNCYKNTELKLDDDLNCSMSDDELKAAGYTGVDNTWVGINGGEVPFTLVMPVVQVTEHSVEVDQAEKKLKVSLKLGNK